MKRVFIIGSPRSGTTWTALLLAQHPEIQACQQIGTVSTLHKFFLFWERGETHTRYHSSAIRFDGAQPQYVPLMTREEMLHISRTMLDQTYALAENMKPGAKVVLDSTPENALTPDLMAELMPDAHYLHIIRDPRSVFASHRKASEDFGARFPRNPFLSAEMWKQHVERARSLGERVPHYHELKYEALKNSGQEELMAVLRWIGVTADPAWCESVLAKTSVESLKGTPGTPKSFFRSGNASGWRAELTDRELHAVEYSARELMIELGYQPVHAQSHQETTRMRVSALKTAVMRRVQSLRRGTPTADTPKRSTPASGRS